MTADRAVRIDALAYDYEARPKERVSACNLCLGRHLVEVSRLDRYGYPAIFVVCARCGLGFISPRLTAAEYAAFYDGVYRPLVSAYHGRRIDAETVQQEQGEYAEELGVHLERALDTTPAKTPWHFKLLILSMTVYLSWRAVQGVAWVIHRI